MRLHTKDQAPKEGGKEASKTPLAKVACWLLEALQKLFVPHNSMK